MKNISLFIASLIIFTGCSVKMTTNHLPGGITEYKDVVNGDTVTIKLKNGECLPNARIEGTYGYRKLILNKRCQVTSAKGFSYDNELLEDPKGDALKSINQGMQDYFDGRRKITHTR